MVQVPAAYQGEVSWAAQQLGIPVAVVAAQINDESGFNPGAVSPTGAEGIAQFEPGTWAGTGCAGSPFNPGDAFKCYVTFMHQLLASYHGNVRNALAAYNAGPGDLGAGYGYADGILSAAGQNPGLQSGGGAGGGGISTTAATADPTCAIALPSAGLGPFSVGGGCFASKTQIRAILGGLMIGAGVVILGFGLAFLAVYGLERSRTAQTVVALVGGGKAAGGKAGRAAGGAAVQQRQQSQISP